MTATAQAVTGMADRKARRGSKRRPVRGAARAGVQTGIVVLQDGEDFIIVPKGNGARLVGAGKAAHGKVRQRDDGTLAYRPDAGYVGRDAFSYEIANRRGLVMTADVTLTIEAQDEPKPKPAATAVEKPAVAKPVAPSAADALAETLPPPTPPLPASPRLEVSEEILGSVSLAGDGALDYTPPDGFVGIDRFTYRLTGVDGSVRAGRVSAWVDDQGETDFQVDEHEIMPNA